MDSKFINIISELTCDLPVDRSFSKLEAYADILHTANESGGSFSTSRRKLMERWNWGGSKVTSFLSFLAERTIIEPLVNQNRTTITLKKCGFKGGERTTCEPESNHLQTTKSTQKTIKTTDTLRTILDAWNKLAVFGIEPIPEFGISSSQYSNLTILAKTYSVTDILQTIEKIKSSDFLQGNTGYGWKISFDWFLKVGNYKKISSGMYNNNSKAINPSKHKDKNKFNQFQQNDYDFGQLEKDLLSN